MTNEVYVSNIVKPISWDNVPSDRVNSVTVKFTFSKEWEGLLCVAQFNQDGECKNQVIDENGECKIPVEIEVGYVALTVFGTKENGEAYRATAIPYVFEVYDSKFCSDGETPIPPTPDLYDQLIAKFLEQVTFPPFDDDLSLTSENAVKNRVITEFLKTAYEYIAEVNFYIAEAALDKNNTDILSEKGKVNITRDGEPIGKGFDLPVVDAELNGESTNAISNSAVFNEFSKIKNLELISDITLEEDTKQISLTQTQDGRPLNLNRVFVYFVGETTTDDYLILRYNSGRYLQLYHKVGGGSQKFAFWVFSEKLFNGAWISKFPKTAITGNISSSGGLQGLESAHRDVMSDISILFKNENVTSVGFGHAFLSDSDLKSDLKAGSRILIYGENNE